MRYNTLLAVVSLGVVGACSDQQSMPTAPRNVGRSWAASATPASQTEFQGFINFCESSPPDVMLTPGGTLHLRGGNRNQWVTGNPLIDGFVENAVLQDLNLKNGDGTAHLDITLRPSAVSGTWEIRQTVKIVDFTRTGTGVGHGTGDLQGLTMKFSTTPAGGTSVCNPEMGRAEIQGLILSPANPG